MADTTPTVGQVFHALGDPTRRTILESIATGPVSVSWLAEPLKLTLAVVVQHLQVLEEAGLIATEEERTGAHPPDRARRLLGGGIVEREPSRSSYLRNPTEVGTELEIGAGL
jgi:DNA-binding transcriptional ArsR family regulator